MVRYRSDLEERTDGVEWEEDGRVEGPLAEAEAKAIRTIQKRVGAAPDTTAADEAAAVVQARIRQEDETALWADPALTMACSARCRSRWAAADSLWCFV